MMNELYNEFLEIIRTGTEQDAQDFLQKNINEFPEELKEKILFAFFEEEVEHQSQQLHALQDVKRDGLSLLTKLEKAKKEYEEAQKIQDLKEDLNKSA